MMKVLGFIVAVAALDYVWTPLAVGFVLGLVALSSWSGLVRVTQ